MLLFFRVVVLTAFIFFSQILSIYDLGYCFEKKIKYFGNTMGTVYNITAFVPSKLNSTVLEKKISRKLDIINKSMSAFLNESEINKFNRIKDTKTLFYASVDFYNVMLAAKNIYDITNGAWDGTVNPLVALWGFRKNTHKVSIPSFNKIKNTLLNIGFSNFQFKGQFKNWGILQKKNSSVTVDLASIAKGYGVDEIIQLLTKNNVQNCIVEIGGEVSCRGTKQNKELWKVGINFPSIDAGTNQIYKIVLLSNMAMATSGNYRNFFKLNGRLYSHILNPKTGWPVDNNVVSVSVIAKSCSMADGLATAIVILGKQKGIKLVDNIDNTECLIITQKDGIFLNHFSKGFQNFIK